MTRAALVALVLVPSVAAADPVALARPSGKACTTIERVGADDTVDATYHLWTDAKGRPTFLEEESKHPMVAAWTYDADGRLAKNAWESKAITGSIEYRYGSHGEIVETRSKAPASDTTTTLTWKGTFGDKRGAPAYGAMIPRVVEYDTPDLLGGIVDDVPHFTGTVIDSVDAATWTFDDAKHAIVEEYYGNRIEVSFVSAKDGYTRTEKREHATEVQTWSKGHIVSVDVDNRGKKTTTTFSYDDKGRWTGAKQSEPSVSGSRRARRRGRCPRGPRRAGLPRGTRAP